MNKIFITNEEIEMITKYKIENYYDDFIFNDFELIIKHDKYKAVYKIAKTDDINFYHVFYRVIKGIEYRDLIFDFYQEKNLFFCYKNDCPIGGLQFKNSDSDELYEEWIPSDAEYKKENKYCVFAAFEIYMVKQYIMNESFKKYIEIKNNESETKPKKERKPRKEQCKSSKSSSITYLLHDVIKRTSSTHFSDKHRTISCDMWSVRGHFRHMKSGKVVWVQPYKKGAKRTSDMSSVKNKIYRI